MERIRLQQKRWDQAKALFEKFVLAGDGSFVDRETPIVQPVVWKLC
jgi:hypothetical protein